MITLSVAIMRLIDVHHAKSREQLIKLCVSHQHTLSIIFQAPSAEVARLILSHEYIDPSQTKLSL